MVEINGHHIDDLSTLIEVKTIFSSTPKDELVNENASRIPKEHHFLPLLAEKVEIFNENAPNNASQSIRSRDTRIKLKIDIERFQSMFTNVPRNCDTQQKDTYIKVEQLVDKKAT